MVELQHASQALPALHWTFKVHGSGGSYESVAQALMGPLLMVVAAELPQGLPEVGFAEGDDLVEALRLDGEDKALSESVEVGAMRGKTEDSAAALGQHLPEGLGLEWIPIHDGVASAKEEAIEGIGEATGHPQHPSPVWSRRDPRDLNFAGLEVHDEEDQVADEAVVLEDLDAEEVGSPDGSPMGLEEGLPGRALAALRGRLQAMLNEDVLDGAAADGGSQVHQSALDTTVAPAGVLLRHLEHQVNHLLLGPEASGSATSGAIVLPGHQAAIPTQDGLRGDDACDLFEDLAAQDLTPDGEAATLGIIEPEVAVAQLLAKDAVLLKEVLDDVALLAIDPGGERDEEDFEGWWERGAHGGKDWPMAFEEQGEGVGNRASGPSGQAESSPDGEIVIAEEHCGFLHDPIFVPDGTA